MISRRTSHSTTAGFSLVTILVMVGIVGILGLLSVGAYHAQQNRSATQSAATATKQTTSTTVKTPATAQTNYQTENFQIAYPADWQPTTGSASGTMLCIYSPDAHVDDRIAHSVKNVCTPTEQGATIAVNAKAASGRAIDDKTACTADGYVSSAQFMVHGQAAYQTDCRYPYASSGQPESVHMISTRVAYPNSNNSSWLQFTITYPVADTTKYQSIYKLLIENAVFKVAPTNTVQTGG